MSSAAPRVFRRLAMALALAAGVAACSLPAAARNCAGSAVGLPPLTDLGAAEHLGFQGGLYPGGSNEVPSGHAPEGTAAIQPRGADGAPDPNGKIVVLMIGMSNGVLEFRRLVEKLEIDPEIDPDRIVLAMGAAGGQSAEFWQDPGHQNFDRIENQVLDDLGVTEAQVQVVLVKSALQSQGGPPTLPAADAQVYDLERALGNGARALASRYPNVQQVFYTSRIYAGYATSDLSPEPYAWESGFAIKWLIEAQIVQRSGGPGDPESGDLAAAVAPWLGWGPYLWADGETARNDGFAWACTDLREDDGTHPAEGAIEKVADAWSTFLRTSDLTRPWLLGDVPPPPADCGNGTLDPGEACDDGNTASGDGCDAQCALETDCGNGALEGIEECDDGNTASGDGCDAQCALETDCGNGALEGVEECDDGNTAPADGCSPQCRIEPCTAAPRETCRHAPSGRLTIHERRLGREKLSLRMSRFEAEPADFGDPVSGSTRYGVCLYDSADTLVAELPVDRAGDLCGAKQRECWARASEHTLRYRDRDAEAAGITQLRLRSGAAPRGKLRVRAGNRANRDQEALPAGLAASVGRASASQAEGRRFDPGLAPGIVESQRAAAPGHVGTPKTPLLESLL